MTNDLCKLFKRLNKKDRESHIDLLDKRRQWDYVKLIATKAFNEVIKKSVESHYFESLYIQTNKTNSLWEGRLYKNFNFIALCMGQHPTDISYTEFDKGKKHKIGVVSEAGGALLISQLPNGGVTFQIYPCSSELHNSEREPQLIKVFKRPYNIDETHIIRAVKQMLYYANDTSYTRFYPLWKYCILWLKQHKKDILLMLIGAILGAILGTIIAVYIRTNTESQSKSSNAHVSVIHK
jgi:hypothetical protein